MSDEEYEYEYSSGAEESAQEDGDASGENDDAILIANTFYEADDAKIRMPLEAIDGFEKVVQLEKEKGTEVKWRFKALRALVILYVEQGSSDKMLTRYQELLTLISHVTSNESLEAINSVLDTLQVCATKDTSTLISMYNVTLKVLKDAGNERMWFNTALKLAKLHVQTRSYKDASTLVQQLRRSCSMADGSDDPGKGTQLVEIYALEIQLCGASGDISRVSEIYEKVQRLSTAINDPRIMGVVHENFGQLHMAQQKWSVAYDEFFSAFRSYSEAGNVSARKCLKYVVLSNMLSLSQINPFDSQEAKVFKDEPEIKAMWKLRSAYTEKNFDDFYRILNDPQNKISSDEFMLQYLQPLVDSFRALVLQNAIKPYRDVSLDFLAKRVKASRAEVEIILVNLILDGEIAGSIDQVKGFLHLSSASKATTKIYTGVAEWAAALERVSGATQSMLLSGVSGHGGFHGVDFYPDM